MAGIGPRPNIMIGSKIILIIHPAVKLIIAITIFPTDWNIFSNVTLIIIIREKLNAIVEYLVPRFIIVKSEVNNLRNPGIIIIPIIVSKIP